MCVPICTSIQLRLLFETARQHAPAIIFFDEIDGLAPVRSARQDQIHASVVATLLALMDGMDARGQGTMTGTELGVCWLLCVWYCKMR